MSEGAEYIGVTERTMRNYVATGKFRAYKMSSRLVRVDLNEIDAALEPFGGAA